MSTTIAQNIEALCQEQGIDRELVIEAVKEAVRAAAKKQFKGGEDIQVDWTPETGLELSASKVVVDEVANPSTELSIEEARELGGDEVEVGDALLLPMPMEELGRIAAQTAKQILFQKVRDAAARVAPAARAASGRERPGASPALDRAADGRGADGRLRRAARHRA